MENRPGALAKILAPLAEAGANLEVVMGYRHAGPEGRAAIEVYPIGGKKLGAAARATGLEPTAIPALRLEGDDRPGLGYAIAQALAAAGINVAFFMAQVNGSRYSAVAGFETEDDAKRAAALIRRSAGR